MRFAFVTILAASLLVSAVADAAPPSSARKSKVANVDALPAAKADPALAGRALLVKDLPKGLSAADRKALDGVVHELHSQHLEAAVALFRDWAAGPPKPIWRDDAVNTALWVFREGILSRSEELASAADRVRFFDERNAAADDSLALLRGAVVTKKPVLVAKLLVLTPYAREARGDERRERQIPYEALDAELRTLETKVEEIKNERNSARVAFASLNPQTSHWMQVLAVLTRHATDMKLSSPAKI